MTRKEYDFADYDEIDDLDIGSTVERTINMMDEEVPVDVALAPCPPRQIIGRLGRKPDRRRQCNTWL